MLVRTLLLAILLLGLDSRVALGQQVESCPRTADFWRQQCFAPVAQLDLIARCVDQSSVVIDWPDGQEMLSFCAELSLSTDARTRARREYIAMLASVCAFHLGAPGPDSVFVRENTALWSRLVG